MSQPACKCGCAADRHPCGRSCLTCHCEGYEAPARVLSDEARDKAIHILAACHGAYFVPLDEQMRAHAEVIGVALQELIDHRDSWHREAVLLLKQRDDARNRGTKLADALADADDEIGRLKAALESAHAALSARGEQS